MPEMSYTMVSTEPTGEQGPSEPGYIGGAMMERNELFQGPIITVHVDDIEDALAKVEELGGKSSGGARTSGRRAQPPTSPIPRAI